MKLFKLTPIPSKISDYAWKASPKYNEYMIIRAENEGKARYLAHNATSTAIEKNSNSPVHTMPWKDNELVNCENYSDDKYSTGGPEEILYPGPGVLDLMKY